MLESQFDRLRSEVGDAVRQPDFSTVRSRAGRVRRRRAITSGAVFLATVLTTTGLGYAVQSASHDRGMTGPATATVKPDDVPRMVSVTVSGTDLYGILVRCDDCDAELYVSPDGGATWQRRTTPPAPERADNPRTAWLTPLATGVIAWYERRNLSVDEVLGSASPASTDGSDSRDRPWITSDGGKTWNRAHDDADFHPTVPTVFDGTRLAACALQTSPCKVAILTAQGDLAVLANQPTGIAFAPGQTSAVNAPPDGRLWVSGFDPVTNKPAVATSSDAGRTWRTHVFTAAVPAGPDHLAYVAAGRGDAAYVLTYHADDVVDAYYTADGGKTWRAGDTIRDAAPSAAFVTADGAHVVGMGTGFVAAHGTDRYTPVELPGYPGGPEQTPQINSQNATARYLVTSENGPYLSKDGRTWRQVDLP
ncbi:glycoside hydrolase [Actinoplanes sp. KI2]|uniref:glycoside hydrolase n=1 Tax=Actinoplanes sp. KI2 TaxID=2983315 RepID=UPI0021D60663|nr:glycoside hydrolase [Actinoplanes sp. KI2]MCU7722561.1 glycoside hydrolase [Actinoplanes sp. KI2]